MDSIYLDHNATTPTRPEVIEAMVRCYREGYANPTSQHRPGQRAHRQLEEAREQIAQLLGAELAGREPDRVVFTSGGTEANNLAILGLPGVHRNSPPGRIVISAIEHPSVIEPAALLLEQGWRLDTVPVDKEGRVRTELVPPLLPPQTRLVSVILGNHETGVLQPVSEIATLCREAWIPVNTDAIQVVGKCPVAFRALGVSAMSVAAHKFQGPLGIGALVLRADTPIVPLLFGGPQQWGLRPGTESVALAVGMATALELWHKEQDAHYHRLERLRNRFEQGLRAGLPELVVHGAGAARLPHTSSVAFPGFDAQVLLVAFDLAGVACSVGSACSSGSRELSPTLRAMGLPKDVLVGSLRFSLGATTTEAEIDEAVRRILQVVRQLG